MFFKTTGSATRKMNSSTSTTSTSGVTLMSLLTRPEPPPPPNAMLLLLLHFLSTEHDLRRAALVHCHDDGVDVAVSQIRVGLEVHRLGLAVQLVLEALLQLVDALQRVAVPPHRRA